MATPKPIIFGGSHYWCKILPIEDDVGGKIGQPTFLCLKKHYGGSRDFRARINMEGREWEGYQNLKRLTPVSFMVQSPRLMLGEDARVAELIDQDTTYWNT